MDHKQEINELTMNLILHTNIFERLESSEGVRFYVYDDKTGKKVEKGDIIKGNLTIGIGHNLMSSPLPKDTTYDLLKKDIEKATEKFILKFPKEAADNLTIIGKSIIVEMFFNIGDKVLGFKKMIEAIKNKDPNKAHDEMLDSRWAKEVKQRATILAKLMKSKGIKK